jgi:cytochrome c oxidase subunit 4
MTSDINSRMHEPEEPHDVSRPPAHHHVPYLIVFGALVVFTIITVLVAMKRFESEAVNVLLALLIASIKASLVALFFMHLKFEGKLIYMIFLVPLALCVLLVVALLPDLLPIGDASMTHYNPPAEMTRPAAAHGEH